MESYVLGRLGLCLDPSRAESAGIPARVLRSFGVGIEAELSPKERDIRAKLNAKLKREMKPYSGISSELGRLPGFGPHKGFPPWTQMAITVSADKLKAVCGKIARGLEHHVAGQYVDPPYVLDVFFVDAVAARILEDRFPQPSLHLGPGFQVRRAAAVDDPRHVLYRVTIWNTLLVHASISIPELSGS